MAETYCGKSCAECVQKESEHCPGCKMGPGRHLYGNCNLAGCARSKGHETCASCSLKGHCGTWNGRYSMPDYRRKKAETEARRKAAISGRAVVLRKWLPLLFWLTIAQMVAELVTEIELLAALHMPALILSAVISVAYGVVLILLTSQEEKYRTAGICVLIGGCISGITALVTAGGSVPNWITMLTVLSAVAALVGEYNLYLAHSVVLQDVDDELSEKWCKLWKWSIGFNLGSLGCVLLTAISAFLGAIALIAVGIGMIVVGILAIVYLYRTAETFHRYPINV